MINSVNGSFTTQNLVIRRFVPGDLTEFTALIRNKMNSEYSAYDEQFPTDNASIKGILQYFIDSCEYFAVILISNMQLIGYVCLNRIDDTTCNLGYNIHSAYRGNGYASEAVNEMINFAKNGLHLQRLVSGTAEENVPSVRLLTKAGFYITGKEQGSFAVDENYKPITFTGVSFEYILNKENSI